MSLTVKKNSKSRLYSGGEIITYKGHKLSAIYATKNSKKQLVWQYDVAGPTLNVAAPTSTSSGSPTFSTSSTFTVNGTVSDSQSGVAYVTVNGVKATLSGTSWSRTITIPQGSSTTVTIVAYDNAGNTTTAVRYVRYYSTANYTGGSSSSSGGKTDAYTGTNFYARSSGTVYTDSHANSKAVSFSITFTGNEWPGPLTSTSVVAYNSSGSAIASASGTSLSLNDTQARQCVKFSFTWATEGRNYNIGANQYYGYAAKWSWTQTCYV